MQKILSFDSRNFFVKQDTNINRVTIQKNTLVLRDYNCPAVSNRSCLNNISESDNVKQLSLIINKHLKRKFHYKNYLQVCTTEKHYSIQVFQMVYHSVVELQFLT